MGGVACKGGKDKEAAYYQNSAKTKTILESINRTTGDSDAGIFRKRYVKGRVKKKYVRRQRQVPDHAWVCRPHGIELDFFFFNCSKKQLSNLKKRSALIWFSLCKLVWGRVRRKVVNCSSSREK